MEILINCFLFDDHISSTGGLQSPCMLTRRDIKVAIFDDMIEITSPGKLLP